MRVLESVGGEWRVASGELGVGAAEKVRLLPGWGRAGASSKVGRGSRSAPFELSSGPSLNSDSSQDFVALTNGSTRHTPLPQVRPSSTYRSTPLPGSAQPRLAPASRAEKRPSHLDKARPNHPSWLSLLPRLLSPHYAHSATMQHPPPRLSLGRPSVNRLRPPSGPQTSASPRRPRSHSSAGPCSGGSHQPRR